MLWMGLRAAVEERRWCSCCGSCYSAWLSIRLELDDLKGSQSLKQLEAEKLEAGFFCLRNGRWILKKERDGVTCVCSMYLHKSVGSTLTEQHLETSTRPLERWRAGTQADTSTQGKARHEKRPLSLRVCFESSAGCQFLSLSHALVVSAMAFRHRHDIKPRSMP